MVGRSLWLSCDGGESEMCDEAIQIDGRVTIAELRAEARAQGWMHTRTGLDLCPDHRPNTASLVCGHAECVVGLPCKREAPEVWA